MNASQRSCIVFSAGNEQIAYVFDYISIYLLF